MAAEAPVSAKEPAFDLGGGSNSTTRGMQQPLGRRVPHARTFRHARERIKFMIADGFSAQKIQTYLRLWSKWWACTVDTWPMVWLLEQFRNQCFDAGLKAFVKTMINDYVRARQGDGLKQAQAGV